MSDKRNSNYFKNLLVIFVGFSLYFLSCNFFDESETTRIARGKDPSTYMVLPEKVIGRGRVEPEGGVIQIHPKVEGLIAAVNVQMGDEVVKDQVLFVIEHKMTEAKASIIKAQMKAQQADIRHLDIDLRQTQTGIENSRKNYQRMKEVHDKGAGTKLDLDQAETTLKIKLLESEGIMAQIDKAKARLEELQATLNLEEIARDNYFVRAPKNGIVLDINASVGMIARQDVPLGEFAPKSPTSVLAEVDELFASKVLLDQNAFIRLPGGRDTVAIGKVIELSPSLRRKSIFSEEIGLLEDRRVRLVRIRLNNDLHNLLYGQRVECIVDVKIN